MAQSDQPTGAHDNLLIATLPPAELQRLRPLLQEVYFSLGQTLYDSCEQLHHINFPTTAVITLLYTMEDGSNAEMGLVGNDGAVGIALVLGGETPLNRATPFG